MKLLARLPPHEIAGAQKVLDGLVAEVASGNMCRIWPAVTYDSENNQTRIAFFFEWMLDPAPNDIGEVMAYTDELMGKKPELLTTGKESCSDPANNEWLATGKMPPPKRTN